MNKMGVTAVAVAILLAASTTGARAQDPEEKSWSDTAELSYVSTGGNTEAQTLGFKNTFIQEFENSNLEVKAGAIHVETTDTSRIPVGTSASFVVVEQSTSETTAENYYLNGRYNAKFSETMFWFAGAGWDRNRFAGIDNRYYAEGGVGNIWWDREDLKFRTDYALTYTDQEDVVDDPTVEDSFLGWRLGWRYFNQFTETTDFTHEVVFDQNLDRTPDWRANMINSLQLQMSSQLAVKISHQLLYDNRPSLEELGLENPLGTPTGVLVKVPLDETDTIFTVSLVAKF